MPLLARDLEASSEENSYIWSFSLETWTLDADFLKLNKYDFFFSMTRDVSFLPYRRRTNNDTYCTRTRTSFWWIHVVDIKSRTASRPLPSLWLRHGGRDVCRDGSEGPKGWSGTFRLNLFSIDIVYRADEFTALNEHTSLGETGVARERRRSHHNNTILKLEHEMFAQFWYPLNLENFILERPSMNAILSVWIFRFSWLFMICSRGWKVEIFIEW